MGERERERRRDDVTSTTHTHERKRKRKARRQEDRKRNDSKESRTFAPQLPEVLDCFFWLVVFILFKVEKKKKRGWEPS